jgi:hypothetical protein
VIGRESEGKRERDGWGGERNGWSIEGGRCARGERLGEIVGLKGERRGEGEGERERERERERGGERDRGRGREIEGKEERGRERVTERTIERGRGESGEEKERVLER